MEIDKNLTEEFENLNKGSAAFQKKCSRFVEEINSGRLTIVQLVEQLGVLLVDPAPNNRELGTWILTQVLEGLNSNHFKEEQLKFICNFYADRLKDHHQVIPAVLCGILALSKFDRFPNGSATQILSALFNNVSCQQQQEQDRHNIYKILEILLEKHETELCTMGLEYVCGVISAVDGERNPKNLLLLFNWFPKFLKTVNLGHLTEEAFEVLACYFPVDFKAPTDSNAINRDTLAESLAPCLIAIPQFAEFCFPLILEKLEASLELAKLDALKLLELSCNTFEVASFQQHSTEFWSHIQREIFNNPNTNVEKHCLKTLTAVIKKISNDVNVKDICDTVKRNLLPDSKLFESSCKLLISVAKASQNSCKIVTKDVIPILENTFNITNVKNQKMILPVLVKFFHCYLMFSDEVEDLRNVAVLCLKASWDENSDLKKIAFQCLASIVKYLPQDVRFSLYENLQNLLLMKHAKEVENCFAELAKHYPDEVKERFSNFELNDEYILEAYFDALCVIISHEFFTETVINLLLFYFQKDVNFNEVVIKTLRKILQKNYDNDKIHSVLYEKDVISSLIDWALINENNDCLEKYSFCLEEVSFILKTMIGKQNSEKQKEIMSKELPKISVLNPLRIFLLDGILCNVRRDVDIDYGILNELIMLLSNENHFVIKNTGAQLLGNIINKCNNENLLLSYLEQFNENVKDLTLMAWITKALVMRNHSLANNWVDKLLELLNDDENVASCFRIIINDNFDSLSSKSHCIKTVLYQQKFFTIVTNKLNENYKPEYNSYLLALGYLLENTPKQVILLQFQKIFKLIVLCLDECQEAEILIVILQIIKDLMLKKEKCIEDHITDFLTRFLKLSTFDKSMHVRILALQCLQECTFHFPVYKLLPQKQQVLRILGKSVDDKKRIVRNEAVEARSLWFLIDAPE